MDVEDWVPIVQVYLLLYLLSYSRLCLSLSDLINELGGVFVVHEMNLIIMIQKVHSFFLEVLEIPLIVMRVSGHHKHLLSAQSIGHHIGVPWMITELDIVVFHQL